MLRAAGRNVFSDSELRLTFLLSIPLWSREQVKYNGKCWWSIYYKSDSALSISHRCLLQFLIPVWVEPNHYSDFLKNWTKQRLNNFSEKRTNGPARALKHYLLSLRKYYLCVLSYHTKWEYVCFSIHHEFSYLHTSCPYFKQEKLILAL